MNKTAFLLFILIGLIVCYPPIPKRSSYGYSLGNRDAKVVLEMFVDLTCPDSSQAYFGGIMDVLNHYGKNELNFIIHLHSLPYHRASFPFAQATHVVNLYGGESAVWKWIEISFQNQAEYYDREIVNITNTELIQKMADLSSKIGIDRSDFLRGMSSSVTNSQARVEWKVASSRGVFETPSYIVNDVLISNHKPSWKLEDWKRIIDPLVK